MKHAYWLLVVGSAAALALGCDDGGPDGDGDVDSDVDSDADSDVDSDAGSDADSDGGAIECGETTCDGAGSLCVACNCGGPTSYRCADVPAGCEGDRSCACVAEHVCPTDATCNDQGDGSVLCDTGMD